MLVLVCNEDLECHIGCGRSFVLRTVLEVEPKHQAVGQVVEF